MSVRPKNTIMLLRGYVVQGTGLSAGTKFMFAARSPFGRSVKVFLFGVGAVLPLGSLIWALLLWHGSVAAGNVDSVD